MRGELREIIQSVSQRRKLNRKHAEPIVQVLPEAPVCAISVRQIAIGGGDDAHVDAARPLLADTLELPFLNRAQQFALELERNFADFVEEQRAAISGLKPPGAITHRAGEGAFHVPEELALEQLVRNRRAVHRDQRPLAAEASLVNAAGDDFLAGARLTQDEDAGPGRRDQLDLLSTR